MSAHRNKSTNQWHSLAYHTLATVIALACLSAFFLPHTIFATNSKRLVVAEETLFALFKNSSQAPYKLFGFLPVLSDPSSTLGFTSGLLVYVATAVVTIAFILSIISICLKKRSGLFLAIAAHLYTWTSVSYLVAIISISSYLPTMNVVFDFSSVFLAIVGITVYVISLIVKLGKSLSFINIIRLLLTLSFSACLFIAFTFDHALIRNILSQSIYHEIALFAAIGLTLLNAILESIRASQHHAFLFDIINALIELIASIVLIFLSLTFEKTDIMLLVLSNIAAVISIALLTLSFFDPKVRPAKKEEEVQPVIAEPVEPEFVPVATQQPAPVVEETPTPTFDIKPMSPIAETVEDFFDGKPVDGFIKSLTVEERNQFAELYVIKAKNRMPEIPAYQVYGDNRNFFEMVFVTLGDYRDQIQTGLLSKMYRYLCANYPQEEITV